MLAVHIALGFFCAAAAASASTPVIYVLSLFFAWLNLQFATFKLKELFHETLDEHFSLDVDYEEDEKIG